MATQNKVQLVIDVNTKNDKDIDALIKKLGGLDTNVRQTTTSASGLSNILGKAALAGGAALAVKEMASLADQAFRTADRMNGVKRSLETVYGSAELATRRLNELNEIAKLPGLDPAVIAQFDAILVNMGSNAQSNDKIFRGLAKSINDVRGRRGRRCGGPASDAAGDLQQYPGSRRFQAYHRADTGVVGVDRTGGP